MGRGDLDPPLWQGIEEEKLVLLLLVVSFLMELGNVQGFINHLRDWLDLCAELLFDPVQGEPVVVGDEVNGDTQVAETSRSSDPVEVSLCHLWKVEVDDNVHSLNVNTSCEQI